MPRPMIVSQMLLLLIFLHWQCTVAFRQAEVQKTASLDQVLIHSQPKQDMHCHTFPAAYSKDSQHNLCFRQVAQTLKP